MARVLVSEREDSERRLLTGALRSGGHEVWECEDVEEGLEGNGELEVVVMEADLEVVARVHARIPSVPIVVLGQGLGSKEAIEVIKAGAFDFLPKPVEAGELLELVLEAARSTGEGEGITVSAVEESVEELVGRSRAMARLYRDIAKLAATPVTVLIRGETGTGKELVARALWKHGHRSHEPLIVVNCAAIPENLLESELFGYEKGAFTGATVARKGKFEQAHGATLFLDEIGDMSLPLQAKMLRVLQEKRIERVGGRGEVPVDVRLLAATHQPLEKMVEEGSFREDLFYRLNSAAIVLPPLRDRLGDVGVLALHFLQKMERELGLEEAKISSEAISFLARQSWPGNVRQLQNVLRRALLKRRDLLIGKEDVEELLEGRSVDEKPMFEEMVKRALDEAEEAGEGDALRVVVRQVEDVVIREALQRSGGNQSKASRWLGVTRLTLREKLKR